LLAVTLSFFIFIAWQKLYIEPRTHLPVAATQSQQAAPQTLTSQGAPQASAAQPKVEEKPSRPAEHRKVQSKTGDAILGDGNDVVVGWDLKSYRLGLTPETAAVDIHSVTNLASGNVE